MQIDKVEKNMRKMQAYCDANGLRLRPHVKTHKLTSLALRQIELGAVGITCQKLGEAEVMAAAGVTDILISFPLIGAEKARRLAALARKVKVSVSADSMLGVSTVRAAALEAQVDINVLVEFDSGMKRTGVVSVEEALTLAKEISSAPGLKFAGLMTYPYNSRTVEFALAARKAFGEAGIPIAVISAGGTPVLFRSTNPDALMSFVWVLTCSTTGIP